LQALNSSPEAGCEEETIEQLESDYPSNFEDDKVEIKIDKKDKQIHIF